MNEKKFAIGYELINGPEAILPPAEMDEFGWLEVDLKIILIPHDHKKIESISIFVDDTMNRKNNFLPPLIRHCTWHKEKDDSENNDWPTTEIFYSHIENNEAVDKKIKKIQKNISRFEFKESGLSLKRDVAKIKIDYNKPRFELFSRNGLQTITINSWATEDNNNFSDLVFDLFNYLKKIVRPLNLNGWKERYKQDLEKTLPLKPWDMEL
ncbi:MAG: hypothetical protein GY707_02835 [Desulfobacteraceae bacterium]|nr:hypothetical protein [Desulfobacteraceae bacterium]